MAQDIDNHEESDQPDIRSLRKAAEAGKKAQEELAQMKRELMFAKAGIDTASKIGGTMPAVLNAANEVAVEAFLNRRISFPEISATVQRTMDRHHLVSHPSLQQLLEADAWARLEAARS